MTDNQTCHHPPAQPDCSDCCLIGSGSGVINNCADDYSGKAAALRIFAPFAYSQENSLRYTVGTEECGLRLYASGLHFTLYCPERCRRDYLLTGVGQLRRLTADCQEVLSDAEFSLRLWKDDEELTMARMCFTAADPCLAHDSGPMRLTGLHLCEG